MKRHRGLSELAAARRFAVVILLGIYLAGTAQAQDTLEQRVSVQVPPVPQPAAPLVVDNIQTAIRRAYEDNPRLLSERSTVRASDARYVQARARYGPTLGFEGSYGYARDRADTMLGRSTVREGFSGTASAILSQPLFTSGRLRSGVQAAEADIAASRQSLRLIEAQVLSAVYRSYIGVRRDRDLVRIVEENLDLLIRQLTQSQVRLRVREITRTDYDQVQTRLAASAAVTGTRRASLSSSEAQFLRFVGAQPAAELAPLPDDRWHLPSSLEEAYAIAERESPLLLLAHARERFSRALLRQAEADLRPSVGLEGSASYGGLQPYSNDLNQSNIRGSLVLTMPVFDSGLRAARVREAREQNEADWRLIDDALREVHAEIEANWSRFVSGREAAVQLQLAANAAQSAYEGVVLQERAGVRTMFEVLDLLRDWLDVQSQLVSAQAEAELGKFGLLAVMGRLEAPVLLEEVQPYSPAVNLSKVRRYGDVPPFTDIVKAAESLVVGDNTAPRRYRDPVAGIRPSALPEHQR